MKFKLIFFVCSFLSIFNINCMNIDQVDFNDIQSVLKFLNEGEKNVNSRDLGGSTLLHKVADNGNEATAELLILRGVDVDSTNPFGLTPLHFAVFSNNTEVMKLLLRYGANPNAKGIQGFTPFHSLLQRTNPTIEIVKLFLQHGADPRLRNDRIKKKPADYTKDQAIKDLLKKAEEELDRKDAEKKSEEVSAASEPSSDKGDKKEA